MAYPLLPLGVMNPLALGAFVVVLTGCATWRTDLTCTGYAFMGLVAHAGSVYTAYTPPEIDNPPQSVRSECGWDQPAPVYAPIGEPR